MRPATASMMKRRGPSTPLQDKPHEGTKLRAAYDLLMRNRGQPVNVRLTVEFDPAIVDRLTDYYGLDVRRIRNGVWLLAGEWDGRAYIDYVAERMECAS